MDEWVNSHGCPKVESNEDSSTGQRLDTRFLSYASIPDTGTSEGFAFTPDEDEEMSPTTATSKRSLIRRGRGRPPSAKTNPALKFFKEGGPEAYICLLCDKKIKAVKGSMSGLRAHVGMHKKKDPLAQREDLKAWIIGTMVSSLNHPLRTFNHPVHQVHFNLMRLGPINESIARRYTDKEAKRAFSVLRQDVEALRNSNETFSLTADEWKWQRKRFLAITLHTSEVIPCLRSRSVPILARFRERATVESLLLEVQARLESIGLTIDDIWGITTDGTAVMKELASLLKTMAWPKPFVHQLCLAHALHLAVQDTFIGKNWLVSRTDEHEEVNLVEDAAGPGLEMAQWQLVAMPNDGELREEEEALQAEEMLAGVPDIRGPFGDLVAKVRDVCRLFHKSGPLNDQLTELSELAGNLFPSKCMLDLKTRWNSTLRMLRNFVTHLGGIQWVYQNLLKRPFPITADEVGQIESFISTLEIVERASKQLSHAELTLRNADIALEIMLQDVKAQQTEFAKALFTNLCFRLLQRRGIQSRLARFVQKRDKNTLMDSYLESLREHLIGKEGFVERSAIDINIAAYRRNDNAVNSSDDRFEFLKNRNEHCPRYSTVKPTSEIWMGMPRNDARKVFPSAMYRLLETLQPTSVPAEHSFSVIRHARRFSQESHSRFEDYLLLKHFYAANKPWDSFLESNESSEDSATREVISSNSDRRISLSLLHCP